MAGPPPEPETLEPTVPAILALPVSGGE
jgi:hypothetical protein